MDYPGHYLRRLKSVSLRIPCVLGSHTSLNCTLRLLEHKELDRKLALISRLIKARYGIVDATYGLDKHGPMEGEPRFLGKFVASNDLIALDAACARMMGFDTAKVLHLINAARFSNRSENSRLESNQDLALYNWEFTLQRNFIDTLSFACFHSDTLARVVFNSPFTRPIYALLGRKPRRRLV